MKHREERRRFWSAVVARFEGSGKSRKEFAAEAGVGLAIFQYWLYKLRRERTARGVRKEAITDVRVRLVPVTVGARAAAPARLELRIAGIRLRVPVGVDPGYVARLASALHEARPC